MEEVEENLRTERLRMPLVGEFKSRWRRYSRIIVLSQRA